MTDHDRFDVAPPPYRPPAGAGASNGSAAPPPFHLSGPVTGGTGSVAPAPPPYLPSSPVDASGGVVTPPPPPPPTAPPIVLGGATTGSPILDLRDAQVAPAPSVAPAPLDAPASPSITARPVEPGTRSASPEDTAQGAHIEAVSLSQWFSGRKVLERCSLTMEPGRVTALIGPSGCGKSTFIRALNRMHELVPGAELAGQVLLNGQDIYSEDVSPTEVRLRIGMVFQKPNPFPAMSIADNVLAGLGLSGTRTEDPVGLVEQCLRRAGLWEEVKDRLHEGGMSLSGGQQQRLCIARSLAVHPDVLLMDEPCSALDPISTRVIEETIRELCEDVTIVIVTHNMQQAQRVSDDCAFFLVEEFGEPGRIVESGPTPQLFDSPQDPRTLDYVSGRFG